MTCEQNPWAYWLVIFCGGGYPRRNHVFQIRWRSVRGLASTDGQILPFPIDVDSHPYNILTLPFERQRSQWETGILTHVDLKPLKILLQKLDTLITLRVATRMPTVMGIGPWVSSPQIAEILTPCDFVYFRFHSLFLVVAYSKNGRTYLIAQYFKRRVFSQGCALWG